MSSNIKARFDIVTGSLPIALLYSQRKTGKKVSTCSYIKTLPIRHVSSMLAEHLAQFRRTAWTTSSQKTHRSQARLPFAANCIQGELHLPPFSDFSGQCCKLFLISNVVRALSLQQGDQFFAAHHVKSLDAPGMAKLNDIVANTCTRAVTG